MNPDSPGDMSGFVVTNPSAVGNPNETPRVFVGTDLAALLRPCAGDAPSRKGYCGGVNGFHADDCPDVTKVAQWRGCCRHAKASHDQHGCTVDVSTDSRWHYRCHDEDEPALDPRWRDCHTLPDEWLLRPVKKWFYQRKRVRPDGTVQYPFRLRWLVILLARYSLRYTHCPKDGQCVLRARHRGSCYWGSDDDD